MIVLFQEPFLHNSLLILGSNNYFSIFHTSSGAVTEFWGASLTPKMARRLQNARSSL